MYDDLKITAASYDVSTDMLTIAAMSGEMILNFTFCGNQFRVESPNDLVDAWIAIPAMIDTLYEATEETDELPYVDAALRLVGRS